MQRATAASPATSTPASSAAQTPATEHLAKRRRIETTTTSSPSISVPGTPTNETPNRQATPSMARGGFSKFGRFEGADTEWVLNVNVIVPGAGASSSAQKKNTDNNVNALNGAASRFNVLAARHEDEENASSEQDDIWDSGQPSGRQTFGSFEKRKRRVVSEQVDNDEVLSSASDSNEKSDSGDDTDSDASYHDHTHKTPTRQHGKFQPKAANDVDSDEEMRQVRRAMEQKHRNMMFGPGGSGARGIKDTWAAGPRKWERGNRVTKREGGRDGGSYKRQKKARKTI